jgi:hypothetical protein
MVIKISLQNPMNCILVTQSSLGMLVYSKDHIVSGPGQDSNPVPILRYFKQARKKYSFVTLKIKLTMSGK